MKHSPRSGAARRARRVTSRATTKSRTRATEVDSGFTLVELLVVIVIMPLVIGAISLGLFSVFSLQNGVSGRLTDTGNAQVVSSVLLKDVQSSAMITEFPTTPQCQSASSPAPQQTQLLGLAWNGGPSPSNSGPLPTSYSTYVSYVTELDGNSYSLLRQYCSGFSTTASVTTILATNLDVTATTAPTISCVPSTDCASNLPPYGPGAPAVWIPANEIKGVTFNVSALVQSGAGASTKEFSYTLSATPRVGAGSSGGPSNFPFAPFTLFGATLACSANGNAITPVLVTGNSANSSITINVGGGTGNGLLSTGSTCNNSIQLGNNSTLGVSNVASANPSLNAVTGGRSTITQIYSASVQDPFANATPPIAPPPVPNGVSTCDAPDINGLSNCPPGVYTSNPGLGAASTFSFTGGQYWFKAGLSLNGQSAQFSNGVYTFGDTGTASALSLGGGTITSNGEGVLFYIKNGAVTWSNHSTVNLTGLNSYLGAAYFGIAIWDAAANGQSLPINISGANSGNSYNGGGIYVPLGGIQAFNNWQITTTFVVADWANFSNNNGVVIQP
jgi:prepilin-type N-terminal cleavage/methylation domain-containing protein